MVGGLRSFCSRRRFSRLLLVVLLSDDFGDFSPVSSVFIDEAWRKENERRTEGQSLLQCGRVWVIVTEGRKPLTVKEQIDKIVITEIIAEEINKSIATFLLLLRVLRPHVPALESRGSAAIATIIVLWLE